MKERPILFSAPMVRAILEVRKTMTRRVVKGSPIKITPFIGRDDLPTHEFGLHLTHDHIINKHVYCPYGQPGDRLWVRETFLYDDFMHEKTAGIPDLPEGQFSHRIVYRASSPDHPITIGSEKWRPSIFMPRKYSRISLEITAIRVERLNDISEKDAKAEGIEQIDGLWKNYLPEGILGWTSINDPSASFRTLWESINDLGSWDVNPWVWVIEFNIIKEVVHE